MKMKCKLFLIKKNQPKKTVEYFVLILVVVIAAQSKFSNAQGTRLYQEEAGIIQPGSRPVERLLYLEDHGVQYQCVQKCYPIIKPKPVPIPPPVVEIPKPPPPVRALIRPTIRPPLITIQPKKLPQVIPMNYCQFMCLRYPYSIQCAKCKPPPKVIIPPPRVIPVKPVPPPAPIRVQPPPQVIFNTMRCCYMNHCDILPIKPACPDICYEPCDATCTGKCRTNPTCPNKCVQVGEKLREYKIKFMIWLHAKLDAIKLTHRQMVEQCILRTRAHYVSQIKALQEQIKAAHPYLFTESNDIPLEMRRSIRHGIAINILGQQNIGSGFGSDQGGQSSQYHVNQNIGINNGDPDGTPPDTPTDKPPQTEQPAVVAIA